MKTRSRFRIAAYLLAWWLALVPARVFAQLSGPITVSAQDAGACATANACATFNAGTINAFAFDVSGTFTGTLTFEGTVDGTNWRTVLVANLATGATTTTTTAVGSFGLPNVGFASLRVRATAWSSGSASVSMRRGFAWTRNWSPFAYPADGVLTTANNAGTTGLRLQFAGVPTAGACGTTPSVTAGSTDTEGEINVGTGTPASCIVNFNTTWTSAPRCVANISTAAAANTRAMGVTTTTTAMTLTPASTFVASSLVWWHCLGTK